MDQNTLKEKLHNFLSLPTETEWVEFKTASNSFSMDELGKYFSALSNEANLKDKERSWLIFGVNDKKEIVGTEYKNSPSAINEAKRSVYEGTGGTSFVEIHEYFEDGKRVLMFEIGPAPSGLLVLWKKIPYAREGESIGVISDVKRSIIMSQDRNDWSGKKCVGATIEDIDNEAITFFKSKLAKENRDDKYLTVNTQEILNMFMLVSDGIPVNAAILLLGKEESANRLLLDKSRISWRYTDEGNEIGERYTFEAPLLPKLDYVMEKIGRFNVHLKESTLFRQDVKQYDELALRELLVNAIAHRDWSIDLWIEVKQTPNNISFKNPGVFRADLIEAIKSNSRPPYLNKRLSNVLQKLNLMEREGGGLKKVYTSQLKKGAKVTNIFDKTVQPSVEFVLHGKVEDPEFAQLVFNADRKINIDDLLMLDLIRGGKNKVGVDISKEDTINLKDKGYIEIRGGKSKKVYISATLSQAVGKQTDYTTSQSMPKDAKKVIVDNHIKKFGKITASEAVKIFKPESSSTIRNLLSRLEKEGFLKRVIVGKNRVNWYYIRATRDSD